MQQQIASHHAATVLGLFEMKPPDRATVVVWICSAWSEIIADVVKAGFEKCGLQSTASFTPIFT